MYGLLSFVVVVVVVTVMKARKISNVRREEYFGLQIRMSSPPTMTGMARIGLRLVTVYPQP